MTKTLTQHLEIIKASGKGIFVPYIMAGDHEKGLDGLYDTIAFLENSRASALKWEFLGLTPLLMDLLLNSQDKEAWLTM